MLTPLIYSHNILIIIQVHLSWSLLCVRGAFSGVWKSFSISDCKASPLLSTSATVFYEMVSADVCQAFVSPQPSLSLLIHLNPWPDSTVPLYYLICPPSLNPFLNVLLSMIPY